MKSSHYWLLAGILLMGAGLRFWHLDFKPLWMDEVITALFSLGRSYYDVGLDQALPLSAFEQVFTFNPDATCAQIAATVSTQSVHPPLFFCWMHQWLGWMNELPGSWVWKLRALPALFGVVTIAAVYQLNRVAFSPKAGLIGAAFIAVSPFAVYLSQEARHYTLPMLLVTLALLGLYHMLFDLHQRQFRPAVWLGWVAVNSLGFYVHYFFLLAFGAQALVLLLEGGRGGNGEREKGNGKRETGKGRREKGNGKDVDTPGRRNTEATLVSLFSHSPVSRSFSSLLTPHSLLLPLLAIALVCLTYLSWLPTFLSHLNRPETEWLDVQATGGWAAIAPVVHLLGGWVLMGVALPVEQQPIGVVVVSSCLMGGFILWLAWRVGVGIWQLWRHSATRLATRMLVGFTVIVILEFLAIAYILGKDLTQVPRYNFIYFPAICALVGASLSQPSQIQRFASPQLSTIPPTRWRSFQQQTVGIVLLVGILSSTLVGFNYAFQKPYKPDQVAKILSKEPLPLLVTVAYNDFQDIALGLSFALQLAKQAPHPSNLATQTRFALMAQFTGYDAVWHALSLLPHPLPLPLNLWAISPGLKRVGYPQQLTLTDTAKTVHNCTIDPANYHRIGVPYQLYRCR